MRKRTEICTIVILLTTVLHQGQSTPAIGFSAIVSKDTYLGDNQAIKYDRVLTNIGNGYDKWSGHFTAPLKGLYFLSCTVMAVNGHSIAVMMVKNGQPMAYAYSNPSAYDTGAISVVLALKKGDKVWIRRFHSGRHIHGDYNLFSGYLVSRKI
uniref:C1q domain-containing protein n=1 Tax=Magallana gigas TaxID=29159 RepID=A0A8W8MTP0_MAGGI